MLTDTDGRMMMDNMGPGAWIETRREFINLAFDRAVDAKRLSSCKYEWNYAGNYMYMGHWDGMDQFKNRMTRTYINKYGTLPAQGCTIAPASGTSQDD